MVATASPEAVVVPTRNGPTRRQRALWFRRARRAVRSLAALETLNALGWQWSVRQFLTARRIAVGIVCAIAAGLGKILGDLAAAVLPPTPQWTHLLGMAMAGIACYVAVVGLCRDIFTRRRTQVAAPAALPFYRAIDIPVGAVAAHRAVMPILTMTIAVSLALVAFGGAAAIGTTLTAAAVLTCICGGLARTCTALFLARRPRVSRRLSIGAVAVLSSACLGIGVALRPLLGAFGPAGDATAGTDLDATDLAGAADLAARWAPGGWTLLLALVTVAITLGAVVTMQWRALRDRSYVIDTGSAAVRARQHGARPTTWVAVACARWIRNSPHHALLMRTLGAAIILTPALLVMATAARAVPGGFVGTLDRALAIVLMVTSLAAGESLAATIGWAAVGPTLRNTWEWGASARSIAGGYLGVVVLHAGLLGVIAVLLSTAAHGSPTFTLLPLAFGTALFGSLADLLQPGRQQPDGSSTTTMTAALIAVAGSCALLATVLATAAATAISAVSVISLLVIGGSWWLVQRRLQQPPF